MKEISSLMVEVIWKKLIFAIKNVTLFQSRIFIV